ncbi:MAG: DoxX family protein [Thermodesulfobacteriota bacterium]
MKSPAKPKPCKTETLAVKSGQISPPPAIAWDDCLTWLYHFLRLALAGIFIFAGVIKLFDPKAFARAIAQYDLVPEGLLPLVAIGLPALEVLAGLGLMLEIRGSLTIITALLFVFLVILGYAVWQNLDIDCGCFTADELDAQHNVRTALWRDLIMIGATLFLYWRRRSRPIQSLWIRKLTIRLKGAEKNV